MPSAVALAVAALASGGPIGGPEQHHLSLTCTLGEMVVSFASAKAGLEGVAAMCELGETPGALGRRFEGETDTYTAGGWVGLLHRVRISGLVPRRLYYYRCSVGDTHGATLRLRAPPARGELPVTIATVGDMGVGCDQPECANATIARLVDEVSADAYDAVIHVGDIAYTAGDQTVWDAFLNEVEPIAATVPYQVCAGNHEHYYNFSGYLHRFAMGATAPPSAARAPIVAVDNLKYSFEVGGVHVTAYSTEHDLGAQLGFLEADLAAVDRARTPWVVVIAHKPFYCSTQGVPRMMSARVHYYESESWGFPRARAHV